MLVEAQVSWHAFCPLSPGVPLSPVPCLIPELLLSIYNPAGLPACFLTEDLPWPPAQQPAGARNRAGLGAGLGGGHPNRGRVEPAGTRLRASTFPWSGHARPRLEVVVELCRACLPSHVRFH